MYIVTVVLLIVVCFTYAESKLRFKNGMLFGFILLALFFSLRSTSYGTDLIAYEWHFNENTWQMLSDLDSKSSAEISWLLLCLLFKPLGFRCFIFFNTFLLCGVMYYLIKRYVPKDWYWFAVFVFLFDTNQFVLNISMMRQSMSISLVALSFIFINDRKWLLSLLLLAVACTVHRSAFITLPFLPIALSNSKRFLKWTIVIVIITVLTLILRADIFSDYLHGILSSEIINEAYGEHLSGVEETSRGLGMGLILQIIASTPMLVAWKDMNIATKKMVLLFMVYFLFCFAALYLAMLFRLGYFFVIWGNLAYPIAYYMLSQRKKHTVLIPLSMLFLTICILYTYYMFFTDSVYSHYFYTFKFCF